MEPKFVATVENMPEVMRQAYRFNQAVMQASKENRVDELTEKLVSLSEAIFLGEQHADVMLATVNFVGNFLVSQKQAAEECEMQMLVCAFQLMTQDFVSYYEQAMRDAADDESDD